MQAFTLTILATATFAVQDSRYQTYNGDHYDRYGKSPSRFPDDNRHFDRNLRRKNDFDHISPGRHGVERHNEYLSDNHHHAEIPHTFDRRHNNPSGPDCSLVRCAAPNCNENERAIQIPGECCQSCEFNPFSDNYSKFPDSSSMIDCADERDNIPEFCAVVSCIIPDCNTNEKICRPKNECCPVCANMNSNRLNKRKFSLRNNKHGFDNYRFGGIEKDRDNFRNEIYNEFDVKREKRFGINKDCSNTACIQVILDCRHGYVFDTPIGECCPRCIPEKSKRERDDRYRKIDVDFSGIERSQFDRDAEFILPRRD